MLIALNVKMFKKLFIQFIMNQKVLNVINARKFNLFY
jgi:hypothetical protein